MAATDAVADPLAPVIDKLTPETQPLFSAIRRLI